MSRAKNRTELRTQRWSLACSRHWRATPCWGVQWGREWGEVKLERGKGQVIKGPLSLFQSWDFILKAVGAGEGIVLSRFQEERDRMCGLGVLLWSLLCEAGLEEGERGAGCNGWSCCCHLGGQNMGDVTQSCDRSRGEMWTDCRHARR